MNYLVYGIAGKRIEFRDFFLANGYTPREAYQYSAEEIAERIASMDEAFIKESKALFAQYFNGCLAIPCNGVRHNANLSNGGAT